MFIDNLKTKTKLVVDETDTPLYKKYLRDMGNIVGENYLIYFLKTSEKNQNKVLESKVKLHTKIRIF